MTVQPVDHYDDDGRLITYVFFPGPYSHSLHPTKHLQDLGIEPLKAVILFGNMYMEVSGEL